MSETKFNWDDLQLFLAVARAGGLSAAARVVGKSAPTLGRRMVVLEAVTGKELFVRLPRGYELTSEGAALFDSVAKLESQIQPLDLSADGKGQRLIKISAGSWMTQALCTRVNSILKDDDNVRLQFISSEQELNITHREILIGIRNQRPEQRGLAAKKIGRVHFAGYAISKTVKPWVKVVGNTPSSRWLAEQITKTQAIEVTSPRNALDLACTGTVRAVLPTFIGDAEPRLQRVTSTITELSHDQWLVMHQDERFRPEVRQTIDRLYEMTKLLHSSR